MRKVSFDDGVPLGAPFLDGHFPDNPIVPGAVLLGYAADALAGQGVEIATVTRMKFMRPLLPDTPFGIEISDGTETATIVWRAEDAVIAQARVALRACGG